MNEDVLISKLESLTRCVSRIKDRIPNSKEQLESDYDVQDIICINLERAVQISVDIATHICADFPTESPKTMSEIFIVLAKNNVISKDLSEKMVKAVGFRNISVHQYQSLDWGVVYSIVTKNLDDFRFFSKQIVNFMNGDKND